MVESQRPLDTLVFRYQPQAKRVNDDLAEFVTPKHRICAVVLDRADKPTGLRQLEPSMILQVAGVGNSSETVKVGHHTGLFYVFREDLIAASEST